MVLGPKIGKQDFARMVEESVSGPRISISYDALCPTRAPRLKRSLPKCSATAGPGGSWCAWLRAPCCGGAALRQELHGTAEAGRDKMIGIGQLEAHAEGA